MILSDEADDQNRLDGTKLKAQHPDIVKQFTTNVTGRKFSVTASKISKEKK